MSFFFEPEDPEDLPEDHPMRGFVERQKQARERQEMAIGSAEHSMSEFIKGLDKDQLGTLATMMGQAHRDPRVGLYYLAQIQTIRDLRYNICTYHDVDHDEEMQTQLAEEAKKET